MIGKTLGHYEIIEPLGTGGMGEVYRARDTKLDREVAIKVLPAEMAADEERLERFRREALSVAALNHPNIVTIHSVEQDGDTHFITLEYVDGKTLDAVVGSGGLPIDKFFDIAIPLTDAVAAAHERGIAHRDLKPSNVMVSNDGRVKVLDFGLAKLLEEPAEADAKTELATHQHLTEEGKVLGTVAYMSPEQAEGKAVDHRSDVFSLGILLYEMATGDRPFKGDTKLSVLSSIVRDEPASITELNVRLPRHLGRIVKKALEKKPTRRYQTVLDVRNDLDELKHEMESGELLVTGAFMADADGLRRSGRSTAANLGMGAVAIVAVLAVAWAAWLTLGAADGAGSGADASPIMNLTPLTAAAAPDVGATISPDGEWLAFSRWREGTGADIYLQSIGSRNALQITHDVEAYSPAFSPDGTQIAFSNFGTDFNGAIYIMGRTGDRLRQLTERGFNPAWSPDGSKIAFGDEFTWTRPYLRNALWPAIGIVDVETGEISELPVPDGVQPAWSPSGERIAYWGVTGGNRDIWTVPADGGEPVRVTEDAAHDYSPVWSPDGRWLYFASDRGGSMAIWRVGIDQSTGITTGEPRQMTTGGSSEPGLMSISADGTRMAYTETIVHSTLWSAPFDPEALVIGEQREPLLQGARRLLDLSIAANGNGDWLIYRNEGPRQDVYVASTDEGMEIQVTDDIAKDWYPRISPDGERVAFYSNASGNYEVWVSRRDGSGRIRLTNREGPDATYAYAPAWSPDGERIAYYRVEVGSFIVDTDTPWDEQEEVAIPNEPGNEAPFRVNSWNADGRRIAGWQGGVRIYDFETGEYTTVAPNGSWPVWIAGDRLMFWNNDDIQFAAATEGADIRTLDSPFGFSDFVLSPDGHRAYFLDQDVEAHIWLMEIEEPDGPDAR